MDLLPIAFVLLIAGVHYSYGLKKCKAGTKITVQGQAEVSQASQLNNHGAAGSPPRILPDCLNTQNTSIANEIVDKHNDLRRAVNPKACDMLKMEWSEEAADNAAKWAAECNLEHSPGEKRTTPKCSCGENLAKAPCPMSWSDVIDVWYGEGKFFTYGVGGAEGKATEHYTQIVNAKSSFLGCAVAVCTDWLYYVCHYCPLGNLDEHFATPYTAGKPCSSCLRHCEARLCTNQCVFVDKAGNCAEMKKYCKDKKVFEYCEATCKC